MEMGYNLNRILPTMFTISNNGKIVSVLSSNVDDLLFGSLQEHEEAMDKILNTFSVRERNSRAFRFCGKEVVQDENFNITVTAKDNTEEIRPIDIGERRRGSPLTTSAGSFSASQGHGAGVQTPSKASGRTIPHTGSYMAPQNSIVTPKMVPRH